MSVTSYCYAPSSAGDNERSLDFYMPHKQQYSSLIVFIHGGAWRSEDKGDYRQLCTDFAEKGFPVVSVNYRLSIYGNNKETPAIQHPTHILDVAQSIQYLTQSPPYDCYKNIYLVGHSAGAHIAMMLLLNDDYGCNSQIAGVVGVSGIYDIPLLLRTFPSYGDFITQAFGTTQLLKASPVSQMPHHSITAKVIIVHSAEDTLIDRSQAESMIQHLQSINIPSTVDFSVKGDHYDIMNSSQLLSIIHTLIK
ncbi:Alpha/Beta hydrolase protein [Pilobolus umbonatus]|nr:Alpha/Beta hydrolase protein [Pilobolus umbonatus]